MLESINNIVSESYKNLINNDNDTSNKRNNRISEKRVDILADQIVSKFGASSLKWRPFYCKVARTLPEGTIWTLIEVSKEKAARSPGGYFMTLAYREMEKESSSKVVRSENL
jgi:hypothetical protein